MEADMAKQIFLNNPHFTEVNVRLGTLIEDDSSTIANLQKNKNNIEATKAGLLNIVSHACDNHSACGDWCKYKLDPENYSHKISPGGKGLSNPSGQDKLQAIFNSFANVADKLSPCGSSQANESLNKIIASTAPKHLHYGGSSSNDIRSLAIESTPTKPTSKPDSIESSSKSLVLAVHDVSTNVHQGSTTVHNVPSTSHDSTSQEVSKIRPRIYSTPSQDNVKTTVNCLNQNLSNHILSRDIGLSSCNADKNIQVLKKRIASETSKLKRLQNNATYQQKFRAKRKKKLLALQAQNPEQKDLVVYEEPGRPRLSDQLIIDYILKIVHLESAADPRRRSITSTTCKTLDQLHQALLATDLQLSRSATYLRLQPKNVKTLEGKKHIVTAPVKLARPTADLHKTHKDALFCTSTIRSLESLASLLGPDQVIFLSQDDKARVPIGITAANHQAPFLMSMEYRVRLPDHDWVVAERHKLIPSVIAGCKISPKGMGDPSAVSYSGPTYVSVRSGKHSSSTASSHAADFTRLLELDAFKNLTRTSDGTVKPIVIFTVDGGPDENPRYGKVIAEAIKHFKKNDLDAIFYATNAPGRSAFNRVERRMAPLSRQLSGLVLPHDSFGSHLDSRGRTIDKDLELQNFAAAGKILASIWSSTMIDGEEVVSTFIHPTKMEEITDPPIPQDWYDKHVRESQYFLQVVKCGDLNCCSKLRSGLGTLLPSGFFPPPILIEQNQNSLTAAVATDDLPKNAEFCNLFVRLALKISIPCKSREVPYDFYCPSVQKVLDKRTCSVCSLYFASEKNLHLHKRNRHGKMPAGTSARVRPFAIAARRPGEILCIHDLESCGHNTIEWLPEDEVIVDEEISKEEEEEKTNDIPVIENFEDWIASPWTES
ncbi:uncharacterized protein LOC123272182 [Cotesia glomerata]|uniref:uncharacterized protein LOC123272182 n=1 Tax=Cotesia glomerata TaxID=32391 RepID=UPI001D00E5C8|nr:uncharacterized protein LOC123272182 [Cotesia glomerata]